ncbi:hypothetical protein GYMLUDRAFT_56264 [Collybiopsis luxurians FD-317 M1]|nr:hypothetical protein GYMLUDRAFT_56264 [Collybiopsis luxurians FD-317 M1]
MGKPSTSWSKPRPTSQRPSSSLGPTASTSSLPHSQPMNQYSCASPKTVASTSRVHSQPAPYASKATRTSANTSSRASGSSTAGIAYQTANNTQWFRVPDPEPWDGEISVYPPSDKE